MDDMKNTERRTGSAGRNAILVVTLTFAVAIAVSTGMTSCAGTPAPLSKDIVLTEKDGGRTFEISAGGLVEIRLEGNPTTGFMWSPVARTDASPVLSALKPVEGSYLPSEPKLTGSGGQFVFKYLAAAPGKAFLEFSYARSWENLPPARSFRVTIVVSDVR